MAKPRPLARSAAEKELRRQEQETRDNLADFIKSVRAVAAESVQATRIDDDERELRRRHHKHFSSSVKELIAILADHPHAHQREYRLFKLWQALGSVSFIANRWTERIERRIKIESAAQATAAKKATTARVDDIIVEAAGPFWRKYQTYKPWRVAGEFCDEINVRLAALPKQKPLGRNAIAKSLKRLRSRIFPPTKVG
jgi:hypothetical protein